MSGKQLKKMLVLNIPYIVVGLLATNFGEAWRLAADQCGEYGGSGKKDH